MVDLAEIQAAYYMVAATGVLVAAIYYVMNMRASRRTQELTLKSQEQNLDTRQAQLFMQIYAKMYDTDFVESRYRTMSLKYKDLDDFNAKCSPEADPDLYRRWWSVGWYMEGLGVLVKRGLINPELVDDLMSGMIISWYEKYDPMMTELRARFNPSAGENVAYMYKVVKEIAVREHPEIKEMKVGATG